MGTATHGSDDEVSARGSTFAKGMLVATPMTLGLWVILIGACKAIF